MRVVCLTLVTGCIPAIPPWTGDPDEDGWMEALDCGPQDPSAHPGAPEICGNLIDEDCDGVDLVCTLDGHSVRHSAWRGENPGAFLGLSVVALPDVDGDSVPDLAMGAIGEDVDRGAVYVLTDRPATSGDPTLISESGVASLTLWGEIEESQLGLWVHAYAPNDALEALGVVARCIEQPDYPDGLVYRVSFPEGYPRQLRDLEVTPGIHEQGVVVERWTGLAESDEPRTIAVAKLDADDTDPALVVGIPEDDALATNAGALVVVRHPAAGYDDTLDTAELIIREDEVGANLGFSLVALDPDRDGLPDVIATSALFGSGVASGAPTQSGVAMLFDPADLSTLSGVLPAGEYRTGELYGRNTFDQVGAFMSALEDLDGDAKGDLAVVAGREERGDASNLPVIYLLSGSAVVPGGEVFGSVPLADHAFLQVEGAADASSAGGGCDSMATADLDGSGAPDLAIAGCFDEVPAVAAGAVYLFLDPPAQGVLTLADATHRIQGSQESERFGSSMVGIRRSVTDAIPADLLVGAPGYSLPGAAHGAGFLLYGDELGL